MTENEKLHLFSLRTSLRREAYEMAVRTKYSSANVMTGMPTETDKRSLLDIAEEIYDFLVKDTDAVFAQTRPR